VSDLALFAVYLGEVHAIDPANVVCVGACLPLPGAIQTLLSPAATGEPLPGRPLDRVSIRYTRDTPPSRRGNSASLLPRRVYCAHR
jgi:hypothetical protein